MSLALYSDCFLQISLYLVLSGNILEEQNNTFISNAIVIIFILFIQLLLSISFYLFTSGCIHVTAC